MRAVLLRPACGERGAPLAERAPSSPQAPRVTQARCAQAEAAALELVEEDPLEVEPVEGELLELAEDEPSDEEPFEGVGGSDCVEPERESVR